MGGDELGNVFEVEFLKKGEFIVLPLSVVRDLIDIAKKSQTSSLKISLERLIPIDYIEYLVNVINGNKGKDLFRYDYLRKDKVTVEDIPLIIERQLGYLAVNGTRCFAEVKMMKFKNTLSYIISINNYCTYFNTE